MANSYRDLIAWQRSVELSVEVYRFTADFPREENLWSHLADSRAAVSIASNIAEGYGRNSRSEYRNFLGIARGSVLEPLTQLEIVKKLGLGKAELLKKAESHAEEVGKIIWAIRKSLDTAPQRRSASPEP